MAQDSSCLITAVYHPAQAALAAAAGVRWITPYLGGHRYAHAADGHGLHDGDAPAVADGFFNDRVTAEAAETFEAAIRATTAGTTAPSGASM